MSIRDSMPASVGQTVEVIGLGRRLVAYLIDAVILWVIQIVLVLCAGAAGAAVATGGDAGAGLGLAINCISFLITAGYFVVFWATTAQTPGKMVMGIKVIGDDGEPVSWGKAVLRYIGYIVSTLVFLIGFIWAGFDAKRQGWHDKIASTLVVRKETTFSGSEAVTFVPSDQGSSTALILVIIGVVLLIVLPIVIIAILLVLGPVIGDVFSNIVEELQTPAPQ